MKTRRPLSFPGRGDAAFSLIEVALALGIIGFALVGIVGALPLAMNNSRISIAQSRAATIAETIFASFRAQPFNAVQFLDTTSSSINLDTFSDKNVKDPPSTNTQMAYFAYFDEVATTAPSSDARRLHFILPGDNNPISAPTFPTTLPIPPTTLPLGASLYQIILRFNNSPAGMLAPYKSASNTTHAQGNLVEVSISEMTRSKDAFRFTSVIANRSE